MSLKPDKIRYQCSSSVWRQSVTFTRPQLNDLLISLYEAGGQSDDTMVRFVKGLINKTGEQVT